jgi:lipopolysaccharide export LptBFGC system permease protein LptF
MAVRTHMRHFVLPILWKHIVKKYCSALGICLFGIVSLLLASKLDDVARFIAFGASAEKIFLFILYQIPYALQTALPLASLVAGFATMASMSSNGELTAARASGYSLSAILTPLSCLSLLLGIVMMWGIFNLSARSHNAAKELEYDVREEEPLAFIQSGRFLAEHGVALELNGSLCSGETAKNVLMCLTPPGADRLSLVILKSSTAEPKALIGKTMTVISSKAPQAADQMFGSLLVENADAKRTPTDFVHEFAKKKHWKPGPDQFSLSVVRAKQCVLRREVAVKQYKGHSAKKLDKQLQQLTSEPYRRLSLSLAVFTLCMAGAVTGIRTSRLPRRFWHALGPLLAFGLFVTAYLTGKNLDDIAPIAICFYIVPHIALWKFSSSLRTRLEHGMEY